VSDEGAEVGEGSPGIKVEAGECAERAYVCPDENSMYGSAWPLGQRRSALMYDLSGHRRGFLDCPKQKPSFLPTTLGSSSTRVSSPMTRSMYLDLVERMPVRCSKMIL
jgi:hypothetical protein